MGMFDSLNDTMQLFKNTLVVISKNKDILKPTITEVSIAAILYVFLIIFGAIFFLNLGGLSIIAMPLFIIFFVFLVIFFPFIKTYYRAAQCWIVYNTFTGNNVSYQDGLKRAGQNKGDIILLTIFDIILTALAKKLKQGTGRGGLFIIINIIMWLLGKVVEEGWDLIGHYLLPASIIPEQNVMQALPEVTHIRNNVPGALAGVFGIDFVGDALKGFIFAMFFVFIILGIGALIFFHSWIPLILLIILMIGLNILVSVLVDMTKTIYFTLFYVSIMMPMKILPQYREEVTHYLLHQSSSQTTASNETIEQKVSKLIPFIQQYRKQGYNDEEILAFLAKNNWPAEAVREALKKAK